MTCGGHSLWRFWRICVFWYNSKLRWQSWESLRILQWDEIQWVRVFPYKTKKKTVIRVAKIEEKEQSEGLQHPLISWTFRTKEVTGWAAFIIKGESYNSASHWAVIMSVLRCAHSEWEERQVKQATYHCGESEGMLAEQSSSWGHRIGSEWSQSISSLIRERATFYYLWRQKAYLQVSRIALLYVKSKHILYMSTNCWATS